MCKMVILADFLLVRMTSLFEQLLKNPLFPLLLGQEQAV